MVFPVVMYGYESWTIKKAESRKTDAFELWCWRRLLSPLDCKEIQPVHPKGNQSWIFIGRTDAKAETPILWPPDVKNWLIGKYPDSGKDWRQEEKGMTEEEMVGWHHQLMDMNLSQLWGLVMDREVYIYIYIYKCLCAYAFFFTLFFYYRFFQEIVHSSRPHFVNTKCFR